MARYRTESVNLGPEELLLRKIREDILALSEKTGFREDYIIKRLLIEKTGFPISIFTQKLGIAESVIVYCRDVLHLKYKEIAQLLRREIGSIGVSYRKAKQKYSSGLDTTSQLSIPFSIFSQSVLTAFENIVFFLKQKNYSFREIGFLLKRNERTIWTTYKRAEVKLLE